MKTHFIDIAYAIAKKKYNTEAFAFDDLWKSLIKEAKMSKAEQEQQIGTLYTDLIQDPRFIYCGSKNWKLKEFVSQGEIQGLSNSLYDFNQEVTEEGFDEETLRAEKEKVIEEEKAKDAPITDMDEDAEEVYEDINSEVTKETSEEEDE